MILIGPLRGDVRGRAAARHDRAARLQRLAAHAPDGAFQQDVRLTPRTDDDALVQVLPRRAEQHSRGGGASRARRVAPPSGYHLCTAPFFETGAEGHAWLNTIVAVGVGERLPNGTAYEVFEIL